MRRTLLLLALGLTGGATVSCSDILFDDPDHTYSGPPVIEFAPSLPSGSYVRTVTFDADSDESRTVSLRVNYVSDPPETAVNAEFRVGDGSSGVQGQHFELPDGTTFTIAAGENFTHIRVEALGAGLSNGESVSVFLELVDGQAYQVSANYKVFELRIEKEP